MKLVKKKKKKERQIKPKKLMHWVIQVLSDKCRSRSPAQNMQSDLETMM